MSDILFEKPSPGATTALVVGDLNGVDPDRFSRYRLLLWCIDSGHARQRPPLEGDVRLQIVPIDEGDEIGLAKAIEEFVHHHPRCPPSIYVTRGLAPQWSEAYAKVVDLVYRAVDAKHRALITRQLDGFAWQSHLLQNLAAYIDRPLPARWGGTLEGLPAFVVGAGPSLDVSLAGLAKHAERGVVFAADSALRALGRVGVGADLAISIDAAKDPARCIHPDTPVPGHAVLSLISPPAWQGALPPERLTFISSRQVTEDWLCGLGMQRPAVAVVENCGSTALELATYMGCDPIFLFGMDLAVDAADPAQRHHREVDPQLYKNSNFNSNGPLPRVPGNYAETVPCFAFGDWHALDARLAARKSPRVFNVTDRGARLRGVTLLNPKRLHLGAPAKAKAARLAALPAATVDARAAQAALVRLRGAGLRAVGILPDLRITLARHGPVALADKLSRLVTDADLGVMLGSYALKLMPHLFPPIQANPDFWQELIEEVECLSSLAAGLRSAPPP